MSNSYFEMTNHAFTALFPPSKNDFPFKVRARAPYKAPVKDNGTQIFLLKPEETRAQEVTREDTGKEEETGKEQERAERGYRRKGIKKKKKKKSKNA